MYIQNLNTLNFSIFQKHLINTITIYIIYNKNSHKSNQQNTTYFTKFYIKLPKIFYLTIYNIFFYIQNTHTNKKKLKITNIL